MAEFERSDPGAAEVGVSGGGVLCPVHAISAVKTNSAIKLHPRSLICRLGELFIWVYLIVRCRESCQWHFSLLCYQ